jgi:hypothetical protein
MDRNKAFIKFKDSNSLLKIKQKAIVLRDLIEKNLDQNKTWPERLELYSLCANSLQDLQTDLSDIPESNNLTLVPDYELHEVPDYVPNLICPILNENIEKVANECSDEFKSSIVHNHEQQAMNFNAFCHELRRLFKK